MDVLEDPIPESGPPLQHSSKKGKGEIIEEAEIQQMNDEELIGGELYQVKKAIMNDITTTR